MKAYIVPNLDKDTDFFYTESVCAVLKKAGIPCLMQAGVGFPKMLDGVQYLPHEQALSQCDIVITIGGDGTTLHSARDIFGQEKLLLGINLGRMGFLSALERTELNLLHNLASGDYITEDRALLSVQVNGEKPALALNEAVIAKGSLARAIAFEVYCDGIFVDEYNADGLILATPTGSTAYSLSAGGPIIDSNLATTTVTPICAHRLASPSLVFDAQRELKVLFKGPQPNTEAFLTLDGAQVTTLNDGDKITVTKARETLKLVYFNELHQFTSIKKKLK